MEGGRTSKSANSLLQSKRYLKDVAASDDDNVATRSSRTRFPLNWERQLDIPNAPVTGIDWRQAADYCTYLTNTMQGDDSLSRRWIARPPKLDEWQAMAGVAEAKKWSEGAFERKFSFSVRPVGVFLEHVSVYGHQDLSDGVWEWIGPSLKIKRRRKRIVSSKFDGMMHTPYWRRIRGLLQSPTVGFRVVFESCESSECGVP